MPGNLRGILWITLGTVAFALNDVLVKLLGKKFGPMELAFCRYSIGLIILSPVFFQMGISGLKTRRPGIHFVRLIIACIAQLGVFYSVIHLYLADATAAFGEFDGQHREHNILGHDAGGDIALQLHANRFRHRNSVETCHQ
mgnify:CR=1 FL=1